jgi:hypothetical protein
MDLLVSHQNYVKKNVLTDKGYKVPNNDKLLKDEHISLCRITTTKQPIKSNSCSLTFRFIQTKTF